MKKIFLLFLLLIQSLTLSSQTYNSVVINQNDGQKTILLTNEIDSITYDTSNKQIVWTKDSLYQNSLSSLSYMLFAKYELSDVLVITNGIGDWSEMRIATDGSVVMIRDDNYDNIPNEMFSILPNEELGAIYSYVKFDNNGKPQYITINECIIYINAYYDDFIDMTVAYNDTLAYSVDSIPFSPSSAFQLSYRRAWGDNNTIRNVVGIIEIASGLAGVVGGALLITGSVVAEAGTVGASTPISIPGIMAGSLAIGGGVSSIKSGWDKLLTPGDNRSNIGETVYFQGAGELIANGPQNSYVPTQYENYMKDPKYSKQLGKAGWIKFFVDLTAGVIDNIYGKTTTWEDKIKFHEGKVITGLAKDITAHSATVRGYVAPEITYGLNGKPIEVEYGIIVKGNGNNYTKKYTNEHGGLIEFEVDKLSPAQEYVYFTYILNRTDAILIFAEQKTFKTKADPPKITKFEQLSSEYKPNEFKNNEKSYSYRFHCATTVEIDDLENVEDWGYVYVDREYGEKKLSLKEYGNSYRDTRYAYYRNYPEDYVTFYTYVKYKIDSKTGKRAALVNDDGYCYGDTVMYDLIYDSQPQARTLSMDNIEELRASVMCEYIGFKEINGLCGVEYWADSEIHKEYVLEIEEDGEYFIEMSDLIPNTVYHCRAFIKNDSIYIRADSTITFETPYNPNVRLIDFKQNASYYLSQSFQEYPGGPREYDYKYYSQFIIETELQYPIVKYGCLYRTPNGDYSHHDFRDENRLENGIIYYSTASNLPEDSLVIIPYVMVDAEDGWTRMYGKKMVFSLTHNGNFSGCPDDNHPHAIELGLPSGTKWACCNVGAKVPEQNGGYYMWGESVEKSFYDWTTYKYAIEWDKFEDIGSDISGTQYDAATVLWGNGWQMPTEAQVEELLSNCEIPWAPYNGIYGKYVIVPNGASIFLPLNGSMWGNDTSNIIGGYWTSTHDVTNPTTAKSYQFPNNSIISIYSILRYTGRAIRAVQSQ